MRDAVDRGVLVSVAGGGMHFSYRVAQTMLDAGIMPSFIATDLNSINHRQGCWSFTEVLSQFLALGFPLKDVIELATIKPALAVHKDDVLGRLTEGREADISILDVVEGDWYYDDIEGKLHADIPEIRFYLDEEYNEVSLISTDGGLYWSDDYLESVQNISLTGLGVSQYYSTYSQRFYPYQI